MVVFAAAARPAVLDIFGRVFFFDLGLSIYFLLFNLFLIAQGYTEKSLGLLTSAIAFGSLAGAIPSGMFLKRAGLRRALISCIAAGAIIFSARAIFLSFPLELLLAASAGLVLSLWAVCIPPIVAQTTNEQQRPFGFSLVFSLGIGVGALGGLAGGRLPEWLSGLRALFPGFEPEQATLLLSCCIAAAAIWPARRLTFSPVEMPARSRPVLSPFLLRFLPAVGLWGLVTNSFSPFANVYFAAHLRFPLHKVGSVFAASQMAQVAAVLCAPLVFRRWGLVNGIVCTQLAACLCFVSLAAIGSPMKAAAAYVGLAAFQWMNEPGVYSLLMSKVPEEQRGGASASNSLVMSASQLIAASLAGWAFVRYGYPAVLSVIAAVALLASIVFRQALTVREEELPLAVEDIAP
ncbi:MAG TPA: MFS transporter [Acidobacteriaceae bacterium]|nr:MFS transporter [Acidobacteriaceae bacterium]